MGMLKGYWPLSAESEKILEFISYVYFSLISKCM